MNDMVWSLINNCCNFDSLLANQVHGIAEKVLVKVLVQVEQQPHVGIFDRHPRKYSSALNYRLRPLIPILFISFHHSFSVNHNNSLCSLVLIYLRDIRQVRKSISGDIKKSLMSYSREILC